MRVLVGDEKRVAEGFMHVALSACGDSLCLSSQSGCVIVSKGIVIGTGSNSPPGNVPIERCVKDEWPAYFRSDRSCCVHAEERAILDAVRHHPDEVRGSTLYYIRMKKGQRVLAGAPYCTICSKLALDVGITEFVLWHENGIIAYTGDEYNVLSFAHPPK
ncbi:MAG: hypothetical protein AABW68_01300 [archaeon]